MEIGKKGIYVVQSLIVSYIITGIILCVLALIMYQLKSGTKIAEAGVTATYILASMAAGWTAGRRIGKKKIFMGTGIRNSLFFDPAVHFCGDSSGGSINFRRTRHSISAVRGRRYAGRHVWLKKKFIIVKNTGI